MPTAEKTVQEVSYRLQCPNCCWRHDSDRVITVGLHSGKLIRLDHSHSFLDQISVLFLKIKKKINHSAWTQNSAPCVHLCGGALHSKRLASAADMSVSISDCSKHCVFSYSRLTPFRKDDKMSTVKLCEHADEMQRWQQKFPFSVFRCIKKSIHFFLTFCFCGFKWNSFCSKIIIRKEPNVYCFSFTNGNHSWISLVFWPVSHTKEGASTLIEIC